MGKQSSSPEPTLVLAKKRPGTWQEEVALRLFCAAVCLSLPLTQSISGSVALKCTCLFAFSHVVFHFSPALTLTVTYTFHSFPPGIKHF